MSRIDPNCELCRQVGGTLLLSLPNCRVVRVAEPAYPGFCRVVWTAHVREMTDLTAAERGELMQVVFTVESVVRSLFQPHKINLASFGNVVPHIHWHIIPRWSDDRCFPEPIWGKPQRDGSKPRPEVSDEALTQALLAAFDNH